MSRWTALLLTPWPDARRKAVLLAALLTAPALGFGLFADDWIHLGVIEGSLPSLGSPFDLFRFADGDPAMGAANLSRGPFPWWGLPDLKLAFFRPLASLLAVADHAVFGRIAAGWHLHTLLWFLAVVWLWATVVRRVLPGPAGALAVMLFAIDDTHWLPASWWANRNASIAAVFGLLGLWAHLRWRDDGWRVGLPLSMLAFAVALAGGEAALGMVAYVVAYETLHSGPRWRRAAAIVPVGLLSVGYLALYRHLGYGTFHSGSYIDPVAEPARFLEALVIRLPVLVGGLLGGLPADLWLVWVKGRVLLIAAGLVFAGLVASLVRRAAPSWTESERRAVGWLTLGAALSLVPVAATFPTSRLLLNASLGGSALVAAVLEPWFRVWKDEDPRADRWRGFACKGMVRIHTLYAPLLLTGLITAVGISSRLGERVFLSADLDDTTLAQERVVVVTSADPVGALYPGIVRKVLGSPFPRAWWSLSYAPFPHELRRVDARTFTLQVQGGQMMTTEFEVLFRDPQHPLLPGEQVVLDGMTATVDAIGSRGPTRVRFGFDRPLEDPSLRFLAWKDGRLQRLVMPAPGESLVLPPERPGHY